MNKFVFFILVLFSFSTIDSQELDATVLINTEKLSPVYKENLEVFQMQIQDYLNNTRFTGENWESPKIKCCFNIFFIFGEDRVKYKAQVVVNSARAVEGTENSSLMLNVKDNKWSFQYNKNQSIYYQPNIFNPLNSFLDFYALITIGMEADSYAPLAGTAVFQEALNIALMGGSTGYRDSWGISSSYFNKRGFIEDATSAGFQKFRQDIFNYHYNGIDVFSRDKEKAYKSFVDLIDNLAGLNNRHGPFINAFFNAKYSEIISYLEDYEDRTIFTKLVKIDPAHTAKYIEAEER